MELLIIVFIVIAALVGLGILVSLAHKAKRKKQKPSGKPEVRDEERRRLAAKH